MQPLAGVVVRFTPMHAAAHAVSRTAALLAEPLAVSPTHSVGGGGRPLWAAGAQRRAVC